LQPGVILPKFKPEFVGWVEAQVVEHLLSKWVGLELKPQYGKTKTKTKTKHPNK
jgi:hypothetical protein